MDEGERLVGCGVIGGFLSRCEWAIMGLMDGATGIA
jgi:hypothetical protein